MPGAGNVKTQHGPDGETEAPAIRFDRVTKSYMDTPALCDVSLDIRRGEFLTVIGGSGGGKTTLIKLINGLIAPTSGRVYVNGIDVANADHIALRRSIGYAIQNVALFPHMTVGKNIAYVPSLSKMWPKQLEAGYVDELLRTVGLEPAMKSRYPTELSGGQRQRVGIARALAAKPDILLMDEPFGAVDEITRQALQDELLSIHRQLSVTVVFVTHDIHEALKLGTRVLVIDGGTIAQCDTPEKLVNRPANEYVRRLVRGAPSNIENQQI